MRIELDLYDKGLNGIWKVDTYDDEWGKMAIGFQCRIFGIFLQILIVKPNLRRKIECQN